MRIMHPQAIPPFASSNPGHLLAQRVRSHDRLYFLQGMLLLCYMLYPNNKQQRDQFAASVEPVRQRFLEYQGRQDPNFFERRGGIETLAAAARDRHFPILETVSEREWPRVARLFRLVVNMEADDRVTSMRGGASLEKAIKVSVATPPRIQRSPHLRAWASYRDVAHLIAGAGFVAEEANKILVPEGFRAHYIDAVFLAPDTVAPVATAFQHFGLVHPASSKGKLLLDPSTVWRVPERAVTFDCGLPVEPLSSEELTALIG